jgi:hypothetical protein
VTAHWIDQRFQLHEALIAFKKLEGNHTGDYLAQVLFEILEEFNIIEKLFCITTDAASNNTVMTKKLSRLFAERGMDWDYKRMHINCLDHIINLAVQDFLKHIKVVKNEDEEDEEGDVMIIDGEEGSFAATMSKIRGIAKVYLHEVPCNVQLCFKLIFKHNCTLQDVLYI